MFLLNDYLGGQCCEVLKLKATREALRNQGKQQHSAWKAGGNSKNRRAEIRGCAAESKEGDTVPDGHSQVPSRHLFLAFQYNNAAHRETHTHHITYHTYIYTHIYTIHKHTLPTHTLCLHIHQIYTYIYNIHNIPHHTSYTPQYTHISYTHTHTTMHACIQYTSHINYTLYTHTLLFTKEVSELQHTTAV